MLSVPLEKDVTYRSPVRGIVIRPHPDCEPIYGQFDSEFFIQDFVKTQFAGANVHIKVVRLLKTIRPLLLDLAVEDEGEFWETEDRQKLQAHIDNVNSLIAEMKKGKPRLRGPVTMPSGRIADLI